MTTSREFIPDGDIPKLYAESDETLNYYSRFIHLDSADWIENPNEVDKKDSDTPDHWLKRHSSLVRLTGRHPFNCEASLQTLMSKGFITPTSLHYVRNHGATPKIDWEKHIIRIGGIAPNPIEVTMDDLIKLPRHSVAATLVCCGNRRKEQNMIKQTIGFNWGAAGVSTGVWTGVRLSEVLKLAGVADLISFPPGLFVRMASLHQHGGDKLPNGVYGTSVTLEKALDPSQDIILAFMYNGRLLSPDHGYPVRMIVPGFIGGRMVKWVTNIDLQAIESQDYYHFYDNKVLPPFVDEQLAKSEDWWHKQEYICNDLNINSAISSPYHDEELYLNRGQKYTLRGYAYNGGGHPISRVEISTDSGATWTIAQLSNFEKPNRFGKFWCWKLWEFDILHDTLGSINEIVLRAWDDSNNTQPEKPTWNVMGMLNNPWFRVKVHHFQDELPSNENDPIQVMYNYGGYLDVSRVKFEHPTLAGNQTGGWMTKMKGHPSLTTPGLSSYPMDEEKSLSEVVDQPKQSIKKDIASSSFDSSKLSYTMKEVKQHNSAESAWIVVNNRVYDATPFLNEHPGGADSILINAGMDSTEDFEAVHSKKAWKMLEDYYIGELKMANSSSVDQSNGASLRDSWTTSDSLAASDEISGTAVALNPKIRQPFRVIRKEDISPDTIILTFALNHAKQRLGLPVGQHMLISAKIDDKLTMRAYTPISSDLDLGIFKLLIKVYHPTAEFPSGGKMSIYLNSLRVGDTIDVKGPLGHVEYASPGCLSIHHHMCPVDNLVMICAGSGITPIYQVIQAVLSNANDSTKVFMIFANRREVDILLRHELDSLALLHPTRFFLHYLLSRPSDPINWKYFTGYVNVKLVSELMPVGQSHHTAHTNSSNNHRNYALLCGPDGFINQACIPALEAHGYPATHRVIF
eukprot:gene5180-7207_t